MISKEWRKEAQQRAELAAEVTLPIDQFKAILDALDEADALRQNDKSVINNASASAYRNAARAELAERRLHLLVDAIKIETGVMDHPYVNMGEALHAALVEIGALKE